MSSILKALRKIEEEKRVASHAAPDLRMDQGLTQVKPKPLLPLIAGVALGSVCVGLFFLWSASDSQEVVQQPVPEPQRFAAESKPTIPVVVVPQEERVVIPARETVPAQEPPVHRPPSVNAVEPTEVPAVKPVEPSNGPLSEAENERVAEPLVPSRVKTKPVVAVEKAAAARKPEILPVEPLPVKPQALPDGLLLHVSEIFYQDEAINSMAVVNDLPVMVGTFVDSAVVVEIRPEEVVFKVGDDLFDVRVTPAR